MKEHDCIFSARMADFQKESDSIGEVRLGDCRITSIYELVRNCNPRELAAEIYSIEDTAEPLEITKVRSFCDFISALRLVSPDLATSVLRPIDPLDATSMHGIEGTSWPKILGRRIIVREPIGSSAWRKTVASVLSHVLRYCP